MPIAHGLKIMWGKEKEKEKEKKALLLTI